MSALVPILIDFIYHVFLPPFLFVLFLILCLASFGKSLGIRRLYVKWLLKVFKVSYTTQSSICVLCICSAKPIFVTSMYFFSLLPILPIKPELNKEDNLKYNLELDQMTLIPKMIIVQDWMAESMALVMWMWVIFSYT